MGEKQRLLQEEAIRQKNVAASERTKRELAQQEAKHKQAEASRLEAEVAEAIREKNAAASEHTKRERLQQAALEAEVQKAGRRQVAAARREGRLRAGLAVLGALLTAGVWAFDSELIATILQVLSLESSSDVLLRPYVRLVGAAVLVGSFFPAILSLRPPYRMGALTIIMAIAAGGSDLIGPALVTSISGYLAIGASIAVAFMILLEVVTSSPSRTRLKGLGQELHYCLAFEDGAPKRRFVSDGRLTFGLATIPQFDGFWGHYCIRLLSPCSLAP